MEPYQSAVRSMESSHRSTLMLRCKVVVVGDATVGKSALISMFHSGGSSFPKQYLMTAWVDFRVKVVPIAGTTTAVELYLFDCGGQSIFNQIEANNVQYENASFLVLVYDVTNQASFESCGKWLQMVTKGRSSAMPGVLVANKIDLESVDRRVVSQRTGESFAEANGLQYFETSALEADYMEPFTYVAETFAQKYEDHLHDAEGGGNKKLMDSTSLLSANGFGSSGSSFGIIQT